MNAVCAPSLGVAVSLAHIQHSFYHTFGLTAHSLPLDRHYFVEAIQVKNVRLEYKGPVLRFSLPRNEMTGRHRILVLVLSTLSP